MLFSFICGSVTFWIADTFSCHYVQTHASSQRGQPQNVSGKWGICCSLPHLYHVPCVRLNDFLIHHHHILHSLFALLYDY